MTRLLVAVPSCFTNVPEIHPKETRWKVVDWIHLAQGRKNWQAVLNMVRNLRVP
jgi:hypothetical protein